MVSARQPSSKSSCPFNNPLVTVPKAPITIGTIVTFVSIVYSILQKGQDTYPSFHILLVLFCGQPGQQSRQFCKLSIIIIIIISLLQKFSKVFQPVVFHRSLSDYKFPNFSMTLQSALTDFNSAVVSMVSVLPLIYYSSNLVSNLLLIFPCSSVTIGITVTLMFHSFLVLWQGPSICQSFCFLLFSLCFPLKQQNNNDYLTPFRVFTPADGFSLEFE